MALKGTRTGVIVALSSSETCDWWSKDSEIVNGYEYLGTSRTMSANRVSNYFDLKGKHYSIEQCASSYSVIHFTKTQLFINYQGQVIPSIRHLLLV